MKCCPLWSGVEQQSQTITIPPAPILRSDTSGLGGGAETGHQCESRWNRMQTSPEGKLLWKRGWHQEPQLPEETALETLNFNKITNCGEGWGDGDETACGVGSMKYRFMNSIKPHFFLFIGACSIYPMWKKGRKKKSPPDKLLTAWAFTST